jgi:Tol biopolymer transport system component/DNA-binding winged helix-turn-helix (wHTH) protein
MAYKNNVTYIFGEFSLDVSKRTFSKNGERLHLPAKEFDTLLYFLENQDRTLSKDEMMSAIWNDTFVEEGNLAQYVSRLRKILDTNGHSYIQTLPKKGYRFDADVTVINRDRPKRSGRSYWLLALGGLVVIGLTVMAVWYLRTSKTPGSAAETRNIPKVLTDGKQDDGAVEWTSDNHIRFFRRVAPNRLEAWVMDLDGSNQHRETGGIKNLVVGYWSPGGKYVYFMKEGDSNSTYLANSDGSGEIKLPLLVGNSDWAPDGSKFVYETKVNNNAEIFLYTVATRQNIDLTNDPAFDADPSFSPDGKTIAFLSSRDGNAEVYTMNVDGGDIRRITDHPAWDSFPVFSPDGTQLAFVSNRQGETGHIFLKNLNDDSPPMMVSELNGVEGLRSKCWSPDGTQMVVTSDANGKDQVYLVDVDPYKPEVVIADGKADLQFPRVSPDGSRLVLQARLPDHSIELRILETDQKLTKTIFKTGAGMPPLYQMSPAWSPDSARISFSSISDGNSDIYSVRADGSDLQKLTDDPLADLAPVYSPDGREIFFARDFYGQTKLYRMNSDGSNARPVMDRNGYELSPVLSPDGKTLLFSGDRADGRSKGLDLFVVDPADPRDETILVSRRAHDTMAVYSPDGRKIAFVGEGDGNQEIYVMNSDGTGLFRLTRNKAFDSSPAFSHDSRSILFSSNRDGKFAIYSVGLP